MRQNQVWLLLFVCHVVFTQFELVLNIFEGCLRDIIAILVIFAEDNKWDKMSNFRCQTFVVFDTNRHGTEKTIFLCVCSLLFGKWKLCSVRNRLKVEIFTQVKFSFQLIAAPLSLTLSLSLSEMLECAAHSQPSWRHHVSWNWTPAGKCKCSTANKMYIDVSSESCCDYMQLLLREINHLDMLPSKKASKACREMLQALAYLAVHFYDLWLI